MPPIIEVLHPHYIRKAFEALGFNYIRKERACLFYLEKESGKIAHMPAAFPHSHIFYFESVQSQIQKFDVAWEKFLSAYMAACENRIPMPPPIGVWPETDCRKN